MGQTINVQKPDRPVSGASISRGSIAGRKSQFILQSTTSTSSFTVSAGAAHSLSCDLLLWSTAIPTTARNLINLISWANSIGWCHVDVYIDAQVGNNYFGAGTLSAAQRKVHFSAFHELTPDTYSGSTPYSASYVMDFRNDDVSDHVVYVVVTWKYLAFGDSNL